MKENHKRTALPPVVDIGNAGVRVLVADMLEDESLVLRGIGECASAGMAEGRIVDIRKVVASLGKALKEAEIMSGQKIERVLASIADENVHGIAGEGVAVVSDNDVTVSDINKVRDVAVSDVSDASLKVLAALERDYEIDGRSGIRQPLGMVGRRLTGRMHLIVALKQSLENLEKCLVNAGVYPAGNFIFAGLAAAAAVLTEDEKELGVCLADIGAGATNIALFERGVVCGTGVFPIAGDDIHRDIAHMHHVSLEDAERAKRDIGLLGDGDEFVSLSDAGGDGDNAIRKAVLRDTIGHRVDEVLETIGKFMESAGGREHKMSAGLVLVGDGALLPGLVDAARQKLRCAVRLGAVRYRGEKHERVAHPRFAVGMGMLMQAAALRLRAKEPGGWHGFATSLKRLFQGDD